MNIRPLIAALAFVTLGAPLAAHADAPSGDIDTVFAVDQAVKKAQPKFDRKNFSAVMGEGSYPILTTTAQNQKSREEVRKEIASMPLERVGS